MHCAGNVEISQLYASLIVALMSKSNRRLFANCSTTFFLVFPWSNLQFTLWRKTVFKYRSFWHTHDINRGYDLLEEKDNNNNNNNNKKDRLN